MKKYPSIKQSNKQFKAHVFDKLDGSNLRISWDSKLGWYDFATRTRTIEQDHKVYKKGYEFFLETYADELAVIAKNKKFKRFDAFFEFYGKNSIAGRHDLTENQIVTLIDFVPNTRGILFPLEFLEMFGHLPIPKYIGEIEWDESFVQAVRENAVEGISFEGVIGKSNTKQKMAKAKTQNWIDTIVKEFGEEEGGKIVKS